MKHKTSLPYRVQAARRYIAQCFSITNARSLVLLTSVISFVPPLTAQAQSTAIHITIPASSLDNALLQLGQQTTLRFIYTSDLVRDLHTQTLNDTLTAEDALRHLLRGTGIQYTRRGNNVDLWKNLETRQLDPVQVTGHRDLVTEDSGSYAATGASLYKDKQSLKEIPQSVTVITAQQIEDRGMSNLSDAMNNAVGVTVVQHEDSIGGKYYSRGFQISDIRIDGGAIAALGRNDFIADPDLVKYERIEILRGADGLYTGAGEPGGTISLARKRPTDYLRLQANASAGSWNTARLMADISTPIDQTGKIRARLVAATDTRDYFFDTSKASGHTIYGVLETDLSSRTTLMLGGSHEKRQEVPWYFGLPRYNTGEDIGLPRRTSLATDWSRKNHESWEVFGDLTHRFENDWKFVLSATHSAQHYNSKTGYLNGAINPLTLDGLTYTGAYFRTEGYQNQLDANLSGKFTLLERSHDWLIGADYSKHQAQAKSAPLTGGGTVNLARLAQAYWPEPNTPTFGPGTAYTNFPEYGEERSGAYARLKISVSDPLHVIGGVRYSNYKYFLNRSGITENGSTSWVDQRHFVDNGVVTLFGSLIYDLNPDWSTYLSYAEIYKPQAGFLAGPLPGKPLNPITGRTYEWGLKGTHLDGKLNSAAALYYTQRKGEAAADGRYPNNANPDNGSSCCYVEQGNVLSEGIDLELNGELYPNWQIYAGYTYNHNRNKQTGQRYAKNTPSHLFKIWTTYRLPQVNERWTLGAGLIVQSRSSVSGEAFVDVGNGNFASAPYNSRQGGYTVVNASVRYDLSKSLSATLNVNNLFDKRYYAGLGENGKNNYYGAPRNVLLSIRAAY